MICVIGLMKPRMAGEEDTSKCSSNSSCAGKGKGRRDAGEGGGGGGSGSSERANKKLKHKKIPQRGLGVAQLEKLRLEEQQKKQAEPSVGMFSPNNKVTVDDSSSNLPLDNLWQRSLQTCSSMVNASSGISPTLSSEMYFQMEPPSNQSYYGSWLPFNLVSQLTSSGEPALNSHALLPEDAQGSNNTMIRGSSSSGRTVTGNDCLDYDYGFLTLAPPATTHENQELPRTTEVSKRGESTSGSYEQQPFFCFLPMPNLENSQSEVGQNVDLNLKL